GKTVYQGLQIRGAAPHQLGKLCDDCRVADERFQQWLVQCLVQVIVRDQCCQGSLVTAFQGLLARRRGEILTPPFAQYLQDVAGDIGSCPGEICGGKRIEHHHSPCPLAGGEGVSRRKRRSSSARLSVT